MITEADTLTVESSHGANKRLDAAGTDENELEVVRRCRVMPKKTTRAVLCRALPLPPPMVDPRCVGGREHYPAGAAYGANQWRTDRSRE